MFIILLKCLWTSHFLIYFLIFTKVYLFVFGCTGSSLLCMGSPAACSWAHCLVAVHELLLQWPPLLQSTGSRCVDLSSHGLSASVIVTLGLQSTGPATVVPGLS